MTVTPIDILSWIIQENNLFFLCHGDIDDGNLSVDG